MSAAELSLWARVEDLSREGIVRALESKRSLVKTWCMRGASHLLVSADLPVFVGGLMRTGLRRDRDWFKRYGVTDAEMDGWVRAVIDALDNEILTRKELSDRVVKRVGARAKRWVEHSWGGIVKRACVQGLVVFGPNHGREVTFVSRKKWLPRVTDLPGEDAETMLLRRYLHGYGPASLADFGAWAGLSLGEAMPIKERIEKDILQVKIEDRDCLALKEDLKLLQNVQAPDSEEGGVRLLPSFDCYMLGHKDKNHLVDPAHYKLVYRKAGWLSPVVLVEGKAQALWSRRKKGNRLHITVQPFGEISGSVQRQVKEEVADLARFNETPYELSFRKL